MQIKELFSCYGLHIYMRSLFSLGNAAHLSSREFLPTVNVRLTLLLFFVQNPCCFLKRRCFRKGESRSSLNAENSHPKST